MITLPFPTPVNITTTPAIVAVIAPFSSLTVEYYLEEPPQHRLSVKCLELPFTVVLWAGADYDAIAGIWSDADVAARIAALYPN